MLKFDTRVQEAKYKVLREVAREAWYDSLMDRMLDIPERIVPGTAPTMRCCVYKERAIISDRMKVVIGGSKPRNHMINVVESACDGCPVGGYDVTNTCCGCLAHRCVDACKFDAIQFDRDHMAHIDKSKCKECGACARACPFTAIIRRTRPCQNACKIKAITV